MSYTQFHGVFPSADGVHKINYCVFVPDGEIRAVVQISHGMCEYIDRYDEFAEYLTGQGYLVCGNDHLGHGGSVEDESERGWFSEENGWQNAVEDLYSMTKIIRHDYPGVPYFLFGHSMGSFLARAYVTKHGRGLDGAVFCGTSGGMEGIPELLVFIEMLEKVHGGKYRSRLVDKMAFGMYNSKIPDKASRYDWISRDKDIVEMYGNDPKCTFIFTLNGFKNLAEVLWYVSSDKWFETYPKALPTYLIAGSADPVGDYGRGVLKVYNRLSAEDCDVEMKIYDGARHELVNETNRQEVYDDVVDFIEQLLENKACAENQTESED